LRSSTGILPVVLFILTATANADTWTRMARFLDVSLKFVARLGERAKISPTKSVLEHAPSTTGKMPIGPTGQDVCATVSVPASALVDTR
jgi:hypothetical protein